MPTISDARWIWSDAAAPNPRNRFTYFRRCFPLEELPGNSELLLSATSNAQLFINGHVVRRKVARFVEQHITAERIDAAPYLRRGPNVILALHHNWGDIVTFQRTTNTQAGLYIASGFVCSDASWQTATAREFVAHERQIRGIAGGAMRIRYPVVLDARLGPPEGLHDASVAMEGWSRAADVTSRLACPSPVETPGQRENAVMPRRLLAAGRAFSQQPLTQDPVGIAGQVRARRLSPDLQLANRLWPLTSGKPVTIQGGRGETVYVTFDFLRPVHGYPFLQLAAATPGVVIDAGYAEIAHSLHSGDAHVREDGWINTEGVVGQGYADRFITRSGSQRLELPDERTARWLTLHIHFEEAGSVTLEGVGVVESQYPVTPIGTFECGDDRIRQIVDLCMIHAKVTMTDAYVDTPGREDGQWTEDAVPRAALSARYFGDTALRRFLIRTHAQQQTEAGELHPFPPSNYPFGPAHYDWSVQWVGALYDEYRWTADTDFVRKYLPNLVRYWKTVLRHVDDDGLWRTAHVLSDIRANLKPENDRQSSGMVTPRIIERLGNSVELAHALGETQQADAWSHLRERMVSAFRRHHLVAEAGEVPVHVADRSDPEDATLERGYSQASQALAVITQLLSESEARGTLDYAFREPDGAPPAGVARWNNPTAGYLAMAALAHNGLAARAVRHLIERYEPYLPASHRNQTPPLLQSPFGGPLPEYWISREDLGLSPGQVCEPQPCDETGSHGWGALPLLFLHEYLLGIQILKPGGTRLRVMPDAAGLPFVAGHSAVPTGNIFVCWDPQRSILEVHLPPGTTAEIHVPCDAPGRRLCPTQFPAPPQICAEGMHAAVETAGRYVFRISP